MEEQSDISMWREMMAQAEDPRNMGMIMLKPRRVGQTYVNEARGKQAEFVTFEEAGSFKDYFNDLRRKSPLSSDEYYMIMGESTTGLPYRTMRATFPSLWFERGIYDLTGTKRLMSNSTTYQKYYDRIDQLEPEEQVYLSTGRMLTMEGPRRSGRTIKIVQDCIEELIRDGRTILMDHHPRGHDYAYSDFRRAMRQLHPTVEFELEFDKRDRPKIIFITNT